MSAQTPPPPPPPPPPPGVPEPGPAPPSEAATTKPWWQRWWAITVFVVFGLFVLIGITADTDDLEEPADEDGATEQAAEPEPEPESEPDEEEFTLLNLDDTGSFADWDYQVLEVETHSTIGDEVPRGTYAVLLVEFTNHGSTPRSVGSASLLLNLMEAAEYRMDTRASLAHHHEYATDEWHLEDIGPGFSVVVPLVFDVPDFDEDHWGFLFKTQRSGDFGDLIVVRTN